MTQFVENLNFIIALGALLMQVATVLLLLSFFLKKEKGFFQIIADMAGKWGMHISFLLFLATTGMSLYYSEVLGFVPCGLCWLQRIFMYPQVILFGLAVWKKDNKIADYSIALSVFGALIALYQHYLQMGGPELVPCPAIAQAGDCAQRILFEFGYITFPLMAFSTFAFAIALMLFVRRRVLI